MTSLAMIPIMVTEEDHVADAQVDVQTFVETAADVVPLFYIDNDDDDDDVFSATDALESTHADLPLVR